MREKKETPSICMNGDGKNITEQKEVGNHNKTESRNDLVKQGFFFFLNPELSVLEKLVCQMTEEGRESGTRTVPFLSFPVCVWGGVVLGFDGSCREPDRNAPRLRPPRWLLAGLASVKGKNRNFKHFPKDIYSPQGWGRCWKH